MTECERGWTCVYIFSSEWEESYFCRNIKHVLKKCGQNALTAPCCLVRNPLKLELRVTSNTCYWPDMICHTFPVGGICLPTTHKWLWCEGSRWVPASSAHWGSRHIPNTTATALFVVMPRCPFLLKKWFSLNQDILIQFKHNILFSWRLLLIFEDLAFASLPVMFCGDSCAPITFNVIEAALVP